MATTYPGHPLNVTDVIVKTEDIDETTVGNMCQQPGGTEAFDVVTVKEEPENFSDQTAIGHMNQQKGSSGPFDAVTGKEDPEDLSDQTAIRKMNQPLGGTEAFNPVTVKEEPEDFSDTFRTEREDIDIKEEPRDAHEVPLDMTPSSFCTTLEPGDIPDERSVDPVHRSVFCEGVDVQELPTKQQGLFTGNSQEQKEKKQSDQQPSQFKCVWCDSFFKNKTQLKYHEQGEHKGQKRHVCDTCGAAFTRISSLNRHARSHSGLKPYSCDLCDATFARTAYLEVHKRVHSGDKPFVCSQCDARFARATNLQEHKRIHSTERPFCCDMCGATFARSRYLMLHQKRKHIFENP